MKTVDQYTLDWIEMSNGDIHRGIVDFSNQKFVHFYNFETDDISPDIIIVAIIWRLKYRETRFSVFCAVNYPHLRLPRINIVNKKGINYLSSNGVESNKPKKHLINMS